MTLSAVAQEVLTNKTVIDLYRAGLDSTIIVSKIETSSCKFDVSSASLIALKKAKVPANVIQAMMNKSEKISTAPEKKTNTIPPVESNRDVPPQLETINYIHFYDKAAHAAKPLERQVASYKMKKKALGFAGVQYVYEISGNKSSIRLTSDASFIVNIGSAQPDAFVLFKVEPKDNSRQAVASDFSRIGGAQGSKGVVGISIKQVKPGIYELMPSSKLEKGEYLFAPKSGGNLMSTTTSVDVYAFGID